MITKFEDLDLTKQYSYADYLTWQFQERLELIKGYVYKMSPAPARKHQQIVWNVSGVFWEKFKKGPCKVYQAPFDVRLPKKGLSADKQTFTVLQPDLCVICDLDKLDDRGCVGAPDLVVEILSPGNTKREKSNPSVGFERGESNRPTGIVPTSVQTLSPLPHTSLALSNHAIHWRGRSLNPFLR